MIKQITILLLGLALAVAGGLYLSVRPAETSPFKEELGYEKQFVEVLGSRMAYIDTGNPASGRTFVFLHGNPTSSYLWRNVIPHLEEHGRCIAPDLIGMGDSDKLQPKEGEDLDERYSFHSQRKYLWALLDEVKAVEEGKKVVLVIHDWGSALGFDWAAHHEDQVAGIAFMESVMPVGGHFETKNIPFVTKFVFQSFKSILGEACILRLNLFIELVLPHSVQRQLSVKEMAAYRAPFAAAGEDRRPTLTWPREVPFDGEPADVYESIKNYEDWLTKSVDIPKLWVNAEPGAIMLGPIKDFARSLPNTQEVTVSGLHFVQEDHPDEIGEAIAKWQAGFA